MNNWINIVGGNVGFCGRCGRGRWIVRWNVNSFIPGGRQWMMMEELKGQSRMYEIWKKRRFRFEEWKVVFIENNMTCNIDSTRRDMKTFIPKMIFVVSYERAECGMERKFSRVIWTKEWPTLAAKKI
jgi:hypothetical protein